MAEETNTDEKRIRVPDEKFVVEWVRVASETDDDGNRVGTHQMVADSLGLQETSVVQRQYAVNRKLTIGGFEKLPKMVTSGRASVNIAEIAKLAGLSAISEADKADAKAKAEAKAEAKAADAII